MASRAPANRRVRAEETGNELNVDPRNRLNDLTGPEWLPETKSFFFQKGLGSHHPHAQIEREHPAPFSFQDVMKLVRFFTKRGHVVLDPFSGVGSTSKASATLGRASIGIELSPRWHSLACKRLHEEADAVCSTVHRLICGDSREVLSTLDPDSVHFVVTSPPYWSILNKKADHKALERVNAALATSYSDDYADLANIADYEQFLDELVGVFAQSGRVLKNKRYIAIVVSDFRHRSKYFAFHSDLIARLDLMPIDQKHHFVLQGVKVLLQNHKSLKPYGYPFAYVQNVHHQYILILQKKNAA